MSTLVHLKYGYDQSSNRLYRRDEVARSNSASFDELYEYDGLDRLQSFDRGTLNSTNTALTGSPTITQDWTLDSTGNWNRFDQSVVDPLARISHTVKDSSRPYAAKMFVFADNFSKQKERLGHDRVYSTIA